MDRILDWGGNFTSFANLGFSQSECSKNETLKLRLTVLTSPPGHLPGAGTERVSSISLSDWPRWCSTGILEDAGE